jgi:hypothetical protein
MTQPQTIRRPDGSIDFDFYRVQATALRACTLRAAGFAVVAKAAAIGLTLGLVGLAGLAARQQTSDAIDIRAAREQPTWPLHARAEQLRPRLDNATGSHAVR